ncbi:MAG: excinuclease ABC subunit UvrC [Clostridia bacterium]|nr:excinuclease ABC subunit UvrC [Clostridia bacterium]
MTEISHEQILRKKAMTLPLKPGVYIMKDKSGNIIYIGKAKALRNRVSQYFGSHRAHGEKVIKMVSQVRDFEYIVCDSEYEALMLECSLIKQHMPKYNILLKDDKGYHYIKITKGEWPTISAAMQKEEDGNEYLGPYYSSYIVRQTVESARKAFMLPSCTKQLGNKKLNKRPCLNYYIKNCSAPCCSMIKYADYIESVNNALKFIKSGSGASLQELKEQMQEASDNFEFERAAILRDRIFAIQKITQKQKVVSSTYKNQDIIAAVNDKGTICFEVFSFRNGDLVDRREFVEPLIETAEESRAEFILAYYSDSEYIPNRILVDIELSDRETLEQILSEKAGRKVAILLPQKGEQLRLVEMCRNNAAERLSHELGYKGNKVTALEELKALLSLPTVPNYIEAYDVSNTAGSENVAGMVTFMNGVPYKAGYKKFKIKSFVGQDDVRSMAEVLDRRFSEYKNSQDDSVGFGKLPDLILLDGGKGQLSAVLPVLQKYGLNIPIFGMVKDSKHKTRAITAGGADIEIKANRKVYSLIFEIQEEVHRFSVSFHHNRSKKKSLKSSLLEIEGVGKVKADLLLKFFGSVKAISNAEIEELSAVGGIDKKTACSIYNYFHKSAE